MKKRIKTMDIILIVVAVTLLVFTVTMIMIFRETGMIPDTLVTCVFAALGGECGAMAWIKTTKERNKEREYEKEAETAMNEAKKQDMIEETPDFPQQSTFNRDNMIVADDDEEAE